MQVLYREFEKSFIHLEKKFEKDQQACSLLNSIILIISRNRHKIFSLPYRVFIINRNTNAIFDMFFSFPDAVLGSFEQEEAPTAHRQPKQHPSSGGKSAQHPQPRSVGLLWYMQGPAKGPEARGLLVHPRMDQRWWCHVI